MKIVFLAPKYPWHPTGGLRVIYQYANRLVSRGHQVAVVHTRQHRRPGARRSTKARLGGWLRQLGDAVRTPRGVEWQPVDPRVDLRYVPRLDPEHVPAADILVATGWWTAELLHGFPAGHGERFYLIQHYEIWDGPKEAVDRTWRYPMRKVVIAKWLLEQGRTLGVSEAEMRHIPNAIDQEAFRVTRPLEERGERVGMLYHRSPWKGFTDGMTALARVKERVPGLTVALFGATPLQDDVPGWVDYHQDAPQREITEDVYNASSVFLCPSWFEGWGLPGAEAMKCGCALVSTDNGGVRDYAEEGRTALLVPPKDVDGLADRVVRLLKDPSERLRLARAGHAHIQQFSWDRSAERLEAWMEEALEHRAPGRTGAS